MSRIRPVVLCGGAGTRLWPLSRQRLPKPFLPLLGAQSLFQATLARLASLPATTGLPWVVCNRSHEHLVARQLAELEQRARLILEPEGRNTAPAVTLAALAEASQPDELLLVLPADHVIADPQAWALAVAAAATAARQGRLLIFGVTPDRPETGFGYIRAGTAAGDDAAPVAAFVEKPGPATARDYLASGDYLWNSGMFLLPVGLYLDEMRRLAPAVVAACEGALAGQDHAAEVLRPEAAAFAASPAVSVDRALLEKTGLASVVPLASGWSDVGSWTAVHAAMPQDDAGNSSVGDAVARDCTGTHVHAGHRLVAAVGLRDCVVVETPDAVLVTARDTDQAVGELVADLAAAGRSEVLAGPAEERPWGRFAGLDRGPGFQVKRLEVRPGGELSLQKHRHRAEHWVVVAGRARVTRDAEVLELVAGQHVQIPLGAVHRIANPGNELLIIVEVQLGDYLGEDDIVRLEDRYGRAGRSD